MRQETGSNPILSNKKVSIQVKLGGRSFSADNTAVADSAEHVEIIVDTPRVTLAPREVVTLDNAADFLRLTGKSCRTNEQSVCSELQADIVAIIAIDTHALETIIAKWGSRTSFSTPLLDMRHSDEECLTLDCTDKVCYMRHFKEGLQRAEALEATTTEDILFHTTEWLGVGSATTIYIKGNGAAAKLLKKYFKRVICE